MSWVKRSPRGLWLNGEENLFKTHSKPCRNMKLPKGDKIFCLSYADYFLRFFNFMYSRLNIEYGRNISCGNGESSGGSLVISHPSARHSYHHWKAIQSGASEIVFLPEGSGHLQGTVCLFTTDRFKLQPLTVTVVKTHVGGGIPFPRSQTYSSRKLEAEGVTRNTGYDYHTGQDLKLKTNNKHCNKNYSEAGISKVLTKSHRTRICQPSLQSTHAGKLKYKAARLPLTMSRTECFFILFWSGSVVVPSHHRLKVESTMVDITAKR